MNKCNALFVLKKYAALVALSMAALMGVPAPASAQRTAADQLTGKLVITGASTLAPLISEIGKRFESLYPTVRIDVQSGGSSRGRRRRRVTSLRSACQCALSGRDSRSACRFRR